MDESKPKNQTGTELIKELFDLAKTDLESSKILFREKFFPQSMFYLEQSVEKIAKSYALFLKIITEKELKDDIGHIALKIFLKSATEVQKKLARYLELSNKYPQLQRIKNLEDVGNYTEKIDEYKNELEKLIADKDELVSLSEEKIENFLKNILEMEKTHDEAFKKIMEFKDENFEQMKNEIAELIGKLTGIENITQEITDKIKSQIEKMSTEQFKQMLQPAFKKMIAGYKIYVSIFYLSLITGSHATATRYPENIFPSKIYNESLGIIRMYDKIIQVLQTTIEQTEILILEN